MRLLLDKDAFSILFQNISFKHNNNTFKGVALPSQAVQLLVLYYNGTDVFIQYK